ncbi:hypothetical protein XELAEV_18005434mg [Xenopus laevis]|uniref:Uncharacterized protein n=1 Tax=Xenopus laevis TaxID=8355 RepID=A0A974I340_XENLA|nr:hypothetical protein XELAEV_18005434mg [Xenopus laevis]
MIGIKVIQYVTKCHYFPTLALSVVSTLHGKEGMKKKVKWHLLGYRWQNSSDKDTTPNESLLDFALTKPAGETRVGTLGSAFCEVSWALSLFLLLQNNFLLILNLCDRIDSSFIILPVIQWHCGICSFIGKISSPNYKIAR